MKTISALSLVGWILANRRSNAFAGYSAARILQELQECDRKGALVYSTDESGNVNGVVCGSPDTTSKILWVHDILTTSRGVVKQFMQQFHVMFPTYTIQGMNRHGRIRTFRNTNKLESRLI